MVLYDPSCLPLTHKIDAHANMTPTTTRANGISGFCAKNAISAKSQQLGRLGWS